MSKPICMHCRSEGVPRSGKDIYPRRADLHKRQFYACPKCPDVFVGCHSTGRPFGPTMVNKPTRTARMEAHKAFDKLWHLGIVERRTAYQMLAKFLKVKQSEAHIGFLMEADARRVEEWANNHIRMWRQCGCIDA